MVQVCKKRAVALLLLATAGAGCASNFKENYYFGVWEDKNGSANWQPTQFYRFRLNGWSSFGSSTRYEAGWYNAHAVDSLFGTVDPDQAPLEAGTANAASQALVTNIPSVAGDFNDSSGTISLTHARFHPLFSTLPLTQDFATVTADQVTIIYNVSDSGTVTISAINLSGNVDAIPSDQNKAIGMIGKDSIPFEATPDGGTGEFLFQAAASTATAPSASSPALQIVAMGGKFDISANSGGGGSGGTPFLFARSVSDYDDLMLSDGTVAVTGGTTTAAGHELSVEGGMCAFTNPTTVRVTKGWSLRGAGIVQVDTASGISAVHFTAASGPGGGRLHLATTTSALQGIEVLSSDEQGPSSSSFSQDGKSKLAKGSYSLVLHHGTLYFGGTSQAASGAIIIGASQAITSFSLQNDDKQPPTPSDLALTIPKGTVANRQHVSLTLADAVSEANKGGKTVALQGKHHTMFLFGPEGRTRARQTDRRFVVFMTTDPTVLTSRIQALANSQQAQAALTGALFGNEQAQNSSAISSTVSALSKAQADAKEFKSEATTSTITDAQLRGLATQIMNSLQQSP